MQLVKTRVHSIVITKNVTKILAIVQTDVMMAILVISACLDV